MRRVSRIVSLLCGSTLGLGIALVAPVSAQDAPPQKTAPVGKETGDILQKWKELLARREKLGQAMSDLQDEFTKAQSSQQKARLAAKDKPEEIKKLELEFQQTMIGFKDRAQKIQAEFFQQVSPEIRRLAPLVFEKDPKNTEAAVIATGLLFESNRYAEVIPTVEKIQASNIKAEGLLCMKGISQFATHDFEKARATLAQAEKAEPQVFQQLGASFFAACNDYVKYWKDEQAIRAAEAKADDLPQVVFKTSKGDIVMELFENEAPNTVANFISLVEGKKYNGTKFHRVIPNFMAQGGDPNSTDYDPSNDGQGGPGYTIPCECFKENARRHFRGSLSMAHAGKDTGGSQFFITHLPTSHLNPRNLDGQQSGHTVFGRVIKGQEVVDGLEVGDKIETAQVLRKRNHPYTPKTKPDTRLR